MAVTIRAYEELIDFIAAGSTPSDVVEFHPSEAARQRVAELVGRKGFGNFAGRTIGTKPLSPVGAPDEAGEGPALVALLPMTERRGRARPALPDRFGKRKWWGSLHSTHPTR